MPRTPRRRSSAQASLELACQPLRSFWVMPLRPAAGDLIGYTAEEGVRYLGEGKLLMSDSFPGQERSKLCLSSKVRSRYSSAVSSAVCWAVG